MNLHIRDPRALELAQKLANQRGVSVEEAIVAALEAELEKKPETLTEAAHRISAALKAAGKPGGRDWTKEERDQMWGHD